MNKITLIDESGNEITIFINDIRRYRATDYPKDGTWIEMHSGVEYRVIHSFDDVDKLIEERLNPELFKKNRWQLIMNLFDLPPDQPQKGAKKPTKSKTQPPTPKQIPATVNKCGDCSNGTFITYQANIDKDGKPICLKCPFKEFNVGRFENACNEFKKRV